MRHALAAFAIVLPALAGAAPPPLVLPPGSGLKPAATAGRGGTAFDGRALVHGVLVAQWLPDPRRPRRLVASVVLVPGAESAATLPHHEGRPLARIELADGPRALALAVGPAIAGDFAHRRVAAVRAEGVFALERLVVGVGCLAGARAALREADPINVQAGDDTAVPPCPND